jgi:hypothetical protein
VSGVLRRAAWPALLAAAVAASALAAAGGEAQQATCAAPPASPAYEADVQRALRARRDVWGDALLAARGGPTYDGAARFLRPLPLARAPGRRALTFSGVHYVALSGPVGPDGAGDVALHVADGSQIVSRRVGGASVSFSVGRDGSERFGSCLTRLGTPRLRDGHLPILEVTYTDAEGNRYRHESFATRIAGSGGVVSVVALDVEAAAGALVRLTPSTRGLRAQGTRLTAGGRTELVYSAGGTFDGTAVTYEIPAGAKRTLYIVRPITPAAGAPPAADAAAYGGLRTGVRRYWNRRLAEGAGVTVPEAHVMDAYRGVLAQDLALTWRYSIGNAYEQFSWPEGVDVAEVLAGWGHAAVARRMLETSFGRRPRPYPSWKRGQKLVGSALYYQLFRDRGFVARATPVLAAYVDQLAGEVRRDPHGLLGRERYSSDIPDDVYGLHAHAIVWQGLRSMARVWEETGRRELAARTASLATRLEAALRRAVRRSERRLPDGSLFLPARLLDGEGPYDRLTASRPGSYWNLVTPYALASGLFSRGSPEARGALRYMLRHGSRLLGLVRAGAFALYGPTPHFPESGTDQVYGINASRFLALNDEPDQLVLSLYGQLAAGMTPGTFVAGEAASVAPVAGQWYRSMYLPPNGAANAAFLETLRLMLVYEPLDRQARPRGLELAFATPRAWLAPGRRIAVHRLPTSFGVVSYTLVAGKDAVRVTMDVPVRGRLRSLRLRLRLPYGRRVTSVAFDGRPLRSFDRADGTIRLPPRPGRHRLVAGLG